MGKRWDYGDTIGKDSKVIVGVVEDARYVDLKIAPPNMAYMLADASPETMSSAISRCGPPACPARWRRPCARRWRAWSRGCRSSKWCRSTDRLARGVIQDRMVARLTSIFGALALLLASLGLYGTISYGISRRVASSGCAWRSARTAATVLWMVLREALSLVAVGVAVGLPAGLRCRPQHRGAAVRRRRLATPWPSPAGAGLLLVVAAVAAYLPAHRASRIEPMVALGR